MPPKQKFSREDIIKAAFDLTREKGISALTARALGAKLGSSPKPIFGIFESMEEVQAEVMRSAGKLYEKYIHDEMASGRYLPYKASGMGYIRFAKDERELFKLLFMRDRSHEHIPDNDDSIEELIALIMENTGMSKDKARLFHAELWVYVHGIATMIATSYLEWDIDFISMSLTDAYEGLKYRFTGKGLSHVNN